MLTRSNAEQIRLGRRKGNLPKMPVEEKRSGMEMAGLAVRPPMAGPMIVPMDQTKGITAYARARIISDAMRGSDVVLQQRTLMLWFGDQFTDHGLNDTNVSIWGRLADWLGGAVRICYPGELT